VPCMEGNDIIQASHHTGAHSCRCTDARAPAGSRYSAAIGGRLVDQVTDPMDGPEWGRRI